MIVHRKLRIPYDSEPHTSAQPMLLTSSGKWESLYNTHDLVRLFWYWKKLITENKDRLAAALKVRWRVAAMAWQCLRNWAAGSASLGA